MNQEDQKTYQDELLADCQREKTLLWKELISILVLLILGLIREMWLK
jgi:hypothetical protein